MRDKPSCHLSYVETVHHDDEEEEL